MRKIIVVVVLLCSAIAAQRQLDPFGKSDVATVRTDVGQSEANAHTTAVHPGFNRAEAGSSIGIVTAGRGMPGGAALGSPTAVRLTSTTDASSARVAGDTAVALRTDPEPLPAEEAAAESPAESVDPEPSDDPFADLDPNGAAMEGQPDAEDPPADPDPNDTTTDTGQDSPDPFADFADDPFADLEADAAKEAAKEEAGPLGKLGENISGKTYLQYTNYFNERQNKRGADMKDDFWNTGLDLETWTSGEDWRVDASAWAQTGSQNKTFSGISPDDGGLLRDKDELEHRHFVLNELYLTQSFQSWDLTLGKKIAKNGLSTLYSPADVLRPVAGFDPLNARDLGVWQAWADIYQEDYIWTLAVLPIYQPDKVPHPSSRWVNINTGGPQPNFNYPDIDPKDFGWFGRIKTVKNGWDIFASLYAGPGRQYVMKQISSGLAPIRLERNVPDVINPALGYSTTRGRWEFHGEVAHTNSLRGEDQDYFTFVQGTTLTLDGDYVTHRGLQQILATVEVAWEARTGDQTASHFVTTSDSTRTGQSDLISRLQFKVTEEFSMEYSGHYIFKKWGYANRFGGKWEILNNLTWNNGFEFFGGSAGNGPAAGLNNLGVNYGGWVRNNRFISALEYKF